MKIQTVYSNGQKYMCIDDYINYLYRHISIFDEPSGIQGIIEHAVRAYIKVSIKRLEELNKKSAGVRP